MRTMTKAASLAILVALTPDNVNAQNYQQLANAAFARNDFDGARRQLRLAVGRAQTPEERIALRRKVAVTFIFEGAYDEARKEYANIIDTAAESGKREAHDHFALAAISAIEHDTAGVQKHISDASGIQPVTPYLPMFKAIAWGHLRDVEQVAQARAQMDAAAAKTPKDTTAQQAAALTRVIHASLNRDYPGAQRALAPIKGASMRAFANVFLANARRRDGNRSAAAQADARVRTYKDLTIYSAVAWRMIK
jgi:restriction endonuclease Mrr